MLVVDAAARQLSIHPSLPPTGAPARELWAALEARGQLPSSLAALADQLLRLAVEPLLQGGGGGSGGGGSDTFGGGGSSTVPLLLCRQCVVSVEAPSGGGQPVVLQWGDLALGQPHNPEACCQKVGGVGRGA